MVTIRKPVGCSGFELNRQPDNREFYVSQSRGAPASAGAPLLLSRQFVCVNGRLNIISY